ncbi:glycoside hydrolase superfamily [Pseudomassariella vexata]|uniref:alpha-galactosidase n=1 Tax=Pseudomassariella vexata TaxID=1141098 RepID=A0A1Y2DH23_9PEZI|nr:glycoside hydrolase superfamily [Pseudomassariella vexata]ORY58394.1 glycoside hydrolase superfamily [Pseudomassariella vexata]
MSQTPLDESDYVHCSLDSGWSVGANGDDFGRIIYDTNNFDIPSLAYHVHDEGLLLVVYLVPGAFIADEGKTILDTNIMIGSIEPVVQQWHPSVVDQFASGGVDLIKLDFVTPGSHTNNANLPANLSGEVIAYHNAIAQSGRSIRLDISWKLDRSQAFFDIWESSADSMQSDQDIYNAGECTFVAWDFLQRAIENYLFTMVIQYNRMLAIYLDMDSLFVGNEADFSGMTVAERQTMMRHWVGAAANLIVGSDLTHLDALGLDVLTRADQIQAWDAGPDSSVYAVAVLANYGPDQGQGGFGTVFEGAQTVTVSSDDLDITGTDLRSPSEGFSIELEEAESVLYRLTPA